jgi:hypothetical protein
VCRCSCKGTIVLFRTIVFPSPRGAPYKRERSEENDTVVPCGRCEAVHPSPGRHCPSTLSLTTIPGAGAQTTDPWRPIWARISILRSGAGRGDGGAERWWRPRRRVYGGSSASSRPSRRAASTARTAVPSPGDTQRMVLIVKHRFAPRGSPSRLVSLESALSASAGSPCRLHLYQGLLIYREREAWE